MTLKHKIAISIGILFILGLMIAVSYEVDSEKGFQYYRAYQNLGRAYHVKGDLKMAERYYLLALQAPVNTNIYEKSKTWFGLSEIYKKWGMEEKAAKCQYQALVTMNPKDLNKYNWNVKNLLKLHNILIKAKEYEKAKKVFLLAAKMRAKEKKNERFTKDK